MRYNDIRVRSVTDLLTEVKRRKRLKQPIWYRGQEQADWGLETSISRATGGITAETPLITRFKQNAYALLPDRPTNEWEWLFVMRHYGVPTRLLDWTESPLVGLYFAAEKCSKSDGALWSLLPIELNKLAKVPLPHPANIPGFEKDSPVENYLPSKLAGEDESDLLPVAAIAPRNTRRMQAQHGVFTITHRTQKKIEEVGSDHIWRLIIPSGSKQNILRELSALNIGPLTLFPELDRVAIHAREALG